MWCYGLICCARHWMKKKHSPGQRFASFSWSMSKLLKSKLSVTFQFEFNIVNIMFHANRAISTKVKIQNRQSADPFSHSHLSGGMPFIPRSSAEERSERIFIAPPFLRKNPPRPINIQYSKEGKVFEFFLAFSLIKNLHAV